MNFKKLIIAICLTATTFAAQAREEVLENDLEIFWALGDLGAEAETGLGSIYIGVTDVWCTRKNHYSEFMCEMNDYTTQEVLVTQGRKLAKFFDALSASSQMDNSLFATTEFTIESIHCRQSNHIDITEGEQASCHIILANE